MNLPNNLELLKLFTSFLSESGLSDVSIKNYLSDVRHFIRFLDFGKHNNLQEVFENITKYINEYQLEQKSALTPQATTSRRLAAIRRFSTFLDVRFQIAPLSINPAKINSATDNTDKDNLSKKILDQFKQQLINEKKTNSTVKNYLSDLYHYFAWIANQTPFNFQHLEQVLSVAQLQGYIAYQKLTHTSSSVISRRQSSIKKITHFCFANGYIPSDPFEINVTPLKLSPLSWLTRLVSKPKIFSNASKSHSNIKSGRIAVIYHKYNALPFTPYLHLALLVLATTTMSYLFYNQVIKQAKPSSAATSLTPPRRQLSFQGRLSDSLGTPIVTSVNVNFKLWNDPTVGSQLYTSGTCSVTPDTDGVFNSLIGDGVCGSEISQSVFADNRDVYLEVTVGAETLTPRQQIATVGYALNSETLQGYPAANPATINSVPVIDNSGNINISVASPSIISSSGNFNIKGQSLSLTTAVSSGGNIVLQPDAIGAGQILAIGGTTTSDTFRITNSNLTSGSLLSGYIGNDVATGSGNLLLLSSGATESARFRVTADGRTTISTATSSANTAAFIIDQNGTGNIFSGSASGILKFNISNNGTVNNIAGVSHSIGDSSGNLILTSNSSTISLNDNVTFAGTTNLNGLNYTWPASQTVNYVLQTNGSGTLSWVAQTGGGTSYFDQQNGAVYAMNSTVDFFIGGQSTASAKFAVLNINSGTPTASISAGTTGAAYLSATGTLATTAMQSLNIGNSTTGNITLGSASQTIAISSNDWAIDSTGIVTGIGTISSNGDWTNSQGTPQIFLADTSSSQDDYSINVDANAFNISNSTDSRQEIEFLGDGSINLGDNTATKTIDLGGIDNSSSDTINIGTNSTAADILNIGNFNTTTTANIRGGNSWNITATGSAYFQGPVGVNNSEPTAILEASSASHLQRETLTNGALTSGTSWDVAGGMTLVSNAATYTHSGGTGMLAQDHNWIDLLGGSHSNKIYAFTYTISGISGTAPTAVISTTFAATTQSLKTDANGTFTKTFRSKSIPTEFTINITSGAAGSFTIDDLSLKEISGSIYAKNTGLGDEVAAFDGANNTTFLVEDAGVTTFSPTAFDYVYKCTGASCTSADTGSFTDNSDEANTNLGSDFSTIGTGTTSTFYVGLDHPFNIINLDLNTASSGLTLVKEYYNGSAWTAIPEVTDNTSNLTTDGTIAFTIPTNWVRNAVSGIGLTKYWIRLRSSTNVATSPTAYFSTPTTGNRFLVYGQSGDSSPAFFINDRGNVGINTSTPTYKLDVNGDIHIASGSDLYIGNIGLNDTASNTTSGAVLVGVFDEFTNSSSNTVQAVLKDLDTALTANTSLWSQTNGSIYPKNSTVDFFLGGQSTASAVFSVLNVDDNAVGVPVASISSGLAGKASILTADGTLATTDMQSLNIGNSITGHINIGTGSKNLVINSNTWDVSGAGVFSGLTGLTSSGTISFTGLTASSAVYTNGSNNLTSVAPTTGILGFWQRNSGALTPWAITDSINIGATATASAKVHLGGTTGEKSFFMEPVAIGFNSSITNSGIGGGTTALQVDGDILPGADNDAFLGRASTAWNRLYLNNGISNAAGTEQISILNRQLAGGQWNATSTLRVGDTTATMPTGMEFYVVGDATASGSLGALGNAFIGGNTTLTGNVTVGGQITVGAGTGKIDVGTVDPPYTINGEKYATYLSGMIGVKEEVTGTITTNEFINGVGYRKAINFNSQAKGSDLWLFGKTTNLNSNLNRMSVLLTPKGQAKTWYELNQNSKTLYIYASSPTEISYRLSAPRFDDASWSNSRTAGVDGFVINNPDTYQQDLPANSAISPTEIAKINNEYKLLVNNEQKTDISSFSNSLVANLVAGIAKVEELFVNNLNVTGKLVSPLADINQLTVSDATVSGNLYADNIKSRTIDKLTEELGLLNDKYSTASSVLSSLQEKYTNFEENNPFLLSPLATTSATLPDDLTLNSLNSESIITQDLLANGSIFTKSVGSFDTDLFIQPSGENTVHLLANLMTLYPNGKVSIEGDLLVTGNIFANNIDTRTATVSGSLAVSGTANFGQITANDLIIATGETVDASVSGQTASNATIGTATLATGSSELIIANTKINDNTLIYITPVSDTDNQVLFVKSKQSGVGFTVAVSQPLLKETSFNFWLVQTK